MDIGTVSELMRTSVITILTLSGPVLIVAMSVGLLISIFQATTSIQDQTLTFVPKILSILIVLSFLFSWMSSRLITFTRALFERIPDLVQ